jgi:hypothetical protein
MSLMLRTSKVVTFPYLFNNLFSQKYFIYAIYIKVLILYLFIYRFSVSKKKICSIHFIYKYIYILSLILYVILTYSQSITNKNNKVIIKPLK